MAGVATTVDVPSGHIYAGVPSSPGSDLDYTEIAGIRYTLIPGTNILRGEGGPSYFLGTSSPTIIRYDPENDEWQVTTPGSPISINARGPNSPDKSIAGTISVTLPSGTVDRLSIEAISVSPQGRRLAIIPNRFGEPITVDFPDTMPEGELQARFGSDITHFLDASEARQSGIIRYLYSAERQLIERTLTDVDLEAEGYNNTFSGAAAYLADRATIETLQTFNTYYVKR